MPPVVSRKPRGAAKARVLRVLSVFGTRPEAIKMAPVVRALQSAGGGIRSLVCLTAQHRDMLDQIMRAFDLRADVDLDLMQPGQTPTEVFSRVLTGVQQVFADLKPNLVLVQGDTTTTAATSVAVFMARIPLGHVEAGVRTGDLLQPFPEEMNRRLTSIVASLHFPPTQRARATLLREGVPSRNVVVTGNTVIDALKQSLRADYRFGEAVLNSVDFTRRTVLVTLHRRESFGAPMEEVCNAMLQLAARHPDVTFVFPVHKNPSVREVVMPALAGHKSFVLTEPLDYLDFVHLMARSYLIMTDSGGVQEEAPALDRPVLVVREVTERPEGVEAGVSRLVGTNRRRILASVEQLLRDREVYRAMARARNPYGDGKAAERILRSIERWSARADMSRDLRRF